MNMGEYTIVNATSSTGLSGADLVVRGGAVWTGVEGAPDAGALAIRGGRIIAVGSDGEIAPLIGRGTRVLDAAGGMIVPGFIDPHMHVVPGGFRLGWVDLRDASSPDEFARRIAEYASRLPAGSWILGGDWDHTLWGGELPRRGWIDAMTPAHPVWVTRLDGHMGIANSLALELAGVGGDTRVMDGGEIVLDAAGLPTGVLRDNAMRIIADVIPAPTDTEQDAALAAAMAYVNAQGVTSVHNLGTWAEVEVFRRAHAAGKLTTRIYAATPIAEWERMRDEVRARGFGDEWLRIGGIKGFMDGSLGSHTAAFHEPYSDEPGNRGILVNSLDDMRAWIGGADAAGLHLIIHAIGDRANDLLLDIYERVMAENGPRDRRFRVEHAQHLTPGAFRRIAELGVIASVQPYHLMDDGRWAEPVVGPERMRRMYAFRSLLDAGAMVAFGSDWFVAPPTPIEGIYGAVTRRTLDGANPGGWVPEEKVSVEAALRAYTHTGAFASFEEDVKGTLEIGKVGDVAVLGRDLRKIAPEEIGAVEVKATVVGGEVVYGG